MKHLNTIDVADQMLKDQAHRLCPKCDHGWVPEAIYCGYCGTKLGEIVIEEGEDE
jgi:uncharacterized OB-fold protein